METDYKIILGALGVLILIAQITLVGFKLQEKRETRRLFSESNKPNPPRINGVKVPGFAQICIEHTKKLVKIETCLKNLIKTRDEDHGELQEWKTEIRDWFKRIFDRIEK